MCCAKLSLTIDFIDDDKFDIDGDFVILRQEDWNIIEYYLKVSKRAGVLEEEFSKIEDVTTWPMNMRHHV